MTRFISRFFTVALTMLAATSAGAQASDPPSVPDFRYIATRDIDFYGADLDAVFDTTLESCERACSANAQCSAFTFNTRSNACFPKRGVTDRKEYAGAVSAEKIATAPAVLSSAEARAKKLGFLGANDLSDAETLARTIGLRHQGGGLTLDSLLATARAREASGNIAQAMGWTGAAVPRLRPRCGVLATGLIVGFLWGAWHFPLFSGSGSSSGALPPALYLVVLLFSFLPPYRVLMVWVYDRTGSLLVAMVMHFSLIVSNVILVPLAITGATGPTWSLVMAAALWVMVAAVQRQQTLSRQGRGVLAAQRMKRNWKYNSSRSASGYADPQCRVVSRKERKSNP